MEQSGKKAGYLLSPEFKPPTTNTIFLNLNYLFRHDRTSGSKALTNELNKKDGINMLRSQNV
jgi:hypothetical protein